MNVYLQFGLAMCVIVLLSFIATAYLAASFNRRAKADLQAALAPLAALVDGNVELDAAEVRGRYAGHLVFGRMANATEGPGRVFQTDLIDPAGGVSWQLTSDPAKRGDEAPRLRLRADVPDLLDRVMPRLEALADSVVNRRTDRFRVEYDQEAGRLRFSLPMRTRRDIPSPDAFQAQLDFLVGLGPLNREAQGAPNADWSGGRRPQQVTDR